MESDPSLTSSTHDHYISAIIPVLEELADVRVLWKHGLMNPGGPHRRLAGSLSPISIGEDECRVFGRLIEAFRPENAFIVGNAFGLSSTYIALAMRDAGADHVIAMDTETEGDGASCAVLARTLAKRLSLDLLHAKKGESPQDTPFVIESEQYDLVFLDGNHLRPYVRDDLHGVLPYLKDDSVVVFHDYFMPGVREGVAAAHAAGLSCLWLPTSCEMVLATKCPTRLAALCAVFPEGRTDPEHQRRPLAYSLVSIARAIELAATVLVERIQGRVAMRIAPSTERPT